MLALPGIAIGDKIYESANSVVYRGIRDDGLPIIIKMLKQDYPSLSELTRYRQEYEITRKLHLAGVIKAYSQQDYQRTLVILLEDFGGESLDQWIQVRPENFCPMRLAPFLQIAIALTDILGQIHAAHIIHKDINPSNIVLNPDTGVVKFIDFGIATQFSHTNPTFKSPHVLEGTLAYLSPEQTGRMNRSLDYRTDFYSLGVTFYELLTGHLPFPAMNMLELVHCHIAKQPVPPHEMNAAIAKPISDIILKLMAKNAEDRYQSAWGIKADLELCAAQLTETGQIDDVRLGLQDICDRFQIPQKLYGRDKEVALLLAAFDRAALADDRIAGFQNNSEISSRIEMMLVSGYAGIGKSALVQELYKPITAKRGYFISGKFDQFQRNIPYSAIADALQKLVRQLLSEPDEELQQWRSLLQTALGSNGQLIVDVIPEVELIIGKQSPVPDVGATEAQNRFNRVFQQFIRVFCSKDRPLAIFLDDLQWVDSETLKLIELIMLDKQIQSLFLIGAYRDNEVNPTQPLVLTLEQLRKQGAVIQEIVLAPLTLEPLSQLLAETLHQNSAPVRSLAELVLRKTEGNPFFINEFLRFLYSDNLLSFDAERLSWQWNIDQIQAQDITDNVVELMLLKLKKLPELTQQMLCLAACVGAEFNLETLVIVCEQSLKDISLNLLAAVQAGLIQPLSELDENLLVQEYKFLHDRVQQAAYTLIDESQKQVVHLQIGRNLLEKTLPERRSDRLFEIVDHLNHGIELVTDRAERDEIAKLNLMAGQKARASAAFRAVFKFLTTGIKLLADDCWQCQYHLSLALYESAAETAYLCCDFEQMEQFSSIVRQQARTLLDKVKVYEVNIEAYIAQNNPLEAIKTALPVLEMLGVVFPKKTKKLHLLVSLLQTKVMLRGKQIRDLVDLPEMTDLYKLAAMRLLSSICVAAYLTIPELLPLIVFKQIRLSVKHGNASVSASAYAYYGLILCGVLEDINSGHQFGQLALHVLERLNAQAFKAQTLMIFNGAVRHWKEHARETLSPLREACQSGLETGDLEHAAIAAQIYCYHAYSLSQELVGLEREMANYIDTLHQLKQETGINYIQIHRQVVLNLMGYSENPCRLMGEAYDEEKKLPIHFEANDQVAIFKLFLNKLILCYLFQEYGQATKNAEIAEKYSHGIISNLLIPSFHLYNSLILLIKYRDANNYEQKYFLSKVKASQKKMRQWAIHAPDNFQHKYDLVEAETARVLGQMSEAEDFYEKAIQGAKDSKYLQEEALAYELAAKFYLSRGRKKFAQTYLKEAHYCYQQWGATAKVKDLETHYPQFLSQSSGVEATPIRTTAGTTSNTSPIAFDLAAVLKASQAISREIELDQLLRSLMRILIENAGARTGYLILENSGEWAIEAACELSDGENVFATQVLQSMPMANRLPKSIIQYVIRTHEPVILNDATREGNFIHEPYIQNHQPQSLLCLPLLNQRQLIGVLYLENQLATGVFTPDRSQILHLLSTQAAIAIENAKLYSRLREGESRMTQFLEAIPIGIAVVDVAGRPYYANRRAIQLVGKGIDPSVTADQLAETYQVYLAETNQPYPTEKMPTIRALSGDRTKVDDIEIHHGNVTIPIESSGTPVFDEQGNIVYAIAAFQDITERKQTERLLADYNRTLEQQVAERTAALQESEAALRDREQELRLITDALPVCIFYTDLSQRYRFINHACEIWFNCSRNEILGRRNRDFLGEAAYQVVEPYIKQVLTGQSTSYEAEIAYPSGNKHISAIYIPDFDRNAQVRGYYGLILDISDRKRAEEASILEERNRMAREIHDTLAQSFTGILVQIGAAMQVLSDDAEATQSHLEIIDELARIGLAEARRSVTALRPQLLEEGDLDSALHRLVTQMRATADTALIYEIQGTAYPLPAEVENNLLRIGQEALTNAIKYANASEIRVELAYENTQCILRVKDDGRGFGIASIPSSDGFGLLGMSERAERIGAQLTIHSQPSQGTEIIVIVNQA